MKQLIATAIIMAAGSAYASSPALYECIYRYDMKGSSGEKEINETSDCILIIGGEESKFYDYPTFRLDSVSAIPGVADEVVNQFHTEQKKSESYFDQEINTSLKDNTLTVFCNMAPERYKYRQELPLITWEETDETATVCGYTCRKATGEYGGRKWQAWYAEEIAVPFGPWKIGGLPGLVMKATDETGNHNFEAIAFRNGKGEFEPSKIPNQISIAHDKFIELKNEYDKAPMKHIDPTSISGITVFKGGDIEVNGVRIHMHNNGSIPLEYSKAELNGTKKEPSKSRKKTANDVFEGMKVVGASSAPK